MSQSSVGVIRHALLSVGSIGAVRRHHNLVLNQRLTPFFDGVQAYAADGIVPFHTPGHKQGRGAPTRWLETVGAAPLQLDVSDVLVSDEYDDSWHAALAAAERLAAAAYGADFCHFLANGTTGGVHAMLLAAATGRSVIIARNSHRCVIGGLILADATPVYVEPEYDVTSHVWLPPSGAAWHQALADNPDAGAVLPTYPSYEGVASDLGAVVEAARQHGVPVLVDEAHGPHFGLHPRLPLRALDLGVDLSAQSPHKLLGSLTQASWLLGRDGRISRDTVATAMGVLQTTSPSALLYASLDVARRQVALEGHALMKRALAAADEMREYVERLGGIRNVDFSHIGSQAIAIGRDAEASSSPSLWDETKVLIDVAELGLSGYEAAQRLRQWGIQVEMGTARHILALATFGDTPETIRAFCQGLARLVRERVGRNSDRTFDGTSSATFGGTVVDRTFAENSSLPPVPRQVMRPRAAALGPARQLPLAEATGAIASDIVCPYPPGVPVLCPGEQVSVEAVEYLQDILRRGGEVRGLTGDANMPSVRVVAG